MLGDISSCRATKKSEGKQSILLYSIRYAKLAISSAIVRRTESSRDNMKARPSDPMLLTLSERVTRLEQPLTTRKRSVHINFRYFSYWNKPLTSSYISSGFWENWEISGLSLETVRKAKTPGGQERGVSTVIGWITIHWRSLSDLLAPYATENCLCAE